MDFVQHKKTELMVEQPYVLPILHCKYHACWCPGDLLSQDINRHDIDQISQKILSLV